MGEIPSRECGGMFLEYCTTGDGILWRWLGELNLRSSSKGIRSTYTYLLPEEPNSLLRYKHNSPSSLEPNIFDRSKGFKTIGFKYTHPIDHRSSSSASQNLNSLPHRTTDRNGSANCIGTPKSISMLAVRGPSSAVQNPSDLLETRSFSNSIQIVFSTISVLN